jgi:hypothetical protein
VTVQIRVQASQNSSAVVSARPRLRLVPARPRLRLCHRHHRLAPRGTTVTLLHRSAVVARPRLRLVPARPRPRPRHRHHGLASCEMARCASFRRSVDASIFSEAWGRGPYDSLVDVLAVVYNTMSQVSFASKHDPSQSRDHARLCIFHQWKYAPCLTSGGPQRPSGWNATRHT